LVWPAAGWLNVAPEPPALTCSASLTAVTSEPEETIWVLIVRVVEPRASGLPEIVSTVWD
jgi:hypothetical protein